MRIQNKCRILCRVCLCVMVLALLLPAGTVRAQEAIKSPGAFEKLKGDAKYLEDRYRGNYVLDIEETGVIEILWSAINGIANVLFTVIRYLALATVTVFYYAIVFDVGEMFGDEINSIQAALNDSIFEPLLILAIMACLATLLVKYARKDIVGGAVELGKVVCVIVLSMLVVAKSDVVLSYATNITKEIGIEALASVNDSGGLPQGKEDFAAQAAGILWVDLVHEPWKTVEFMHVNEPDEDVIDDFLTTSDAEKRAELVKGFGEDAACFQMTIGFERIGFLIIYLLPCLAKCALFVIVAGALLVFQILAVFYLVLAVIVLLLFAFAGYESILTAWLKKLMETQIMILILMVMLSLLLRTDVFLYDKTGEYGWFIVLLIQIIMGVGLYMGRGSIFGMLSTLQRGMSTPRYLANRMRMGGNISTIQQKATATRQRMMKKGVQKSAAVPAGVMAAKGAAAAQKTVARPVFQNVQSTAAATGQKLQQAGTAMMQTGTTALHAAGKAGKAAGEYIQSGGLGRSAGMAAGTIRMAMPALRDNIKNASEYVKSAPIQFQYAAHQQKEKAVTEIKTAAENAAAKTIAAGAAVGEAGINNYAGVKEGYEEKRKQYEEKKAAQTEKREQHKQSVAAKRQEMQRDAERKATRKEEKSEPPKFQMPKTDR